MILITGCTGFVGKAVAQQLNKRYKIRCLVRYGQQYSYGEIVQGSLTEKATIEKAVKGVSNIIHTAAILDADNPDIFKVNVDATAMLVEAAKKNKVKQFIFISTENVLHDCTDAYSLSKKRAEEKVREFPNHLILREPVIYGPGDKRYIGRLINAIKKWPFIPLPAGGKWTFQPIFIEDIAKYIEQGIKKNITGAYLIAGSESITYKALVRKLMQMMNKKKPLIPIPLFILKSAAAIMEACKIRPPLTRAQINNIVLPRNYNVQEQIKVFNIKPTPLNEGLKKTLETKYL